MSYDKKPAPTHAAVIDWETLSTRSNAVLPSVGVVFGNLDTGEIIDTLHITMDVQSQIDAGYHVSADTLAFWVMQDQHARTYLNRILSDKFKHGSRQDGFRQLFNFLSNLPRNTRIFGNGPTFDLAICIEEWKQCGLPWEFWNERCVRSWIDLCDLAIGGKVRDKVPFEGVKHHPVDDAKHEFKQMHAVLSWMQAMARPTVTLNASELPVDFRCISAAELSGMKFPSDKIRAFTDRKLGETAPLTMVDSLTGERVIAPAGSLFTSDTRQVAAPSVFAMPYGQDSAGTSTEAFSTGGVVGLSDNTAGLDTELEIPVALSAPEPTTQQADHRHSLQSVIDACAEQGEVVSIEQPEDSDWNLFDVVYTSPKGSELTVFIVEAHTVDDVKKRLEAEYYGPSGLWFRLHVRSAQTSDVFEPWESLHVGTPEIE